MKESFKLLGSILALTGMAGTSIANPIGENVVAGSATVSRDGDILTVVTGSDRTVIDWEGFSIDPNQLANFIQPGVDAAVLNRVVGTMPTEILGSLVSNGQVAIINPNGILVDSSGVIDTRGFTASTLDVSNEAFLRGQGLTFQGSSQAAVENRGAIIVREGDVFMMGQTVKNSGSISADNVSLAAGSKIVLKKDGDDHLYVEVEASDENSSVTNTGNISAVRDNLRENGNNPYEYAMARDDSQTATGVQVTSDGRVFLGAGGSGSVVHSGAIKAQNGDSGGEVVLEAEKVDVQKTAVIEATGPDAGGSVKVGGGFQGKDDSMKNARVTRVQNGAVIDASATDDGDGGHVIIWSDDSTFYGGEINATGAGNGAGGFAEVSGKGYLGFVGSVDLGGGSLLLDPDTITIIEGVDPADGDINGDTTTGDDLAAVGDLDDAVADFMDADSIITNAAVVNLLTNNDLTLAAEEAISVEGDLTWDGVAAVGGTSTLTLNAPDISITANIDATNGSLVANTSLGAISLSDGGPVNISADTVDFEGAVTLGGDVTIAATAVRTDSINLDSNTLTIGGAMEATAGAVEGGNLVTNTEFSMASGNLETLSVSGGELSSTSNLSVSGAITGDQTVKVGGEFTAGSTVAAADLIVAGDSSLGGNVTVTNSVDLNGTTTLTGDVVITATDLTAQEIGLGTNALTLSSSNSATTGGITNGALTTTAAATIESGNLTSLSTNGGILTSGGDLVVSGDLDANSGISAAALDVDGNSEISADITTVGSQAYDGNLDTTADLTLTAGGNGVTLGGIVSPLGNAAVGTLNISGDVTLTAGAQIFVNAANPGADDLVSVTGDLNLGGITNLVTEGATGDSFNNGDTITPLTITGSYSNAPANFDNAVISGQNFTGEISGQDYLLTRIQTDFIWTGLTNTLWSEGGNWNLLVSPSDGDALAFPQGIGAGSFTADNDALTSVDSIAFTGAGSDAYTLTGNLISLAGGITNDSGAIHNIDFAGIDLAADQTFAAGAGLDISAALNGAHALNVNGNAGSTIDLGLVGDSAALSSLTVSAGTVNLNGAIDLTGGLTAASEADLLIGGEINAGGNANLTFGTNTGGTLTYNANILAPIAVITGGTENDTVNFGTQPPLGDDQVAVNLGEGTDVVNLTADDDSLFVNGENLVSLGNKINMSGVDRVNALGQTGSDFLYLTLASSVFEATGEFQGTTAGVEFNDFEIVDAASVGAARLEIGGEDFVAGANQVNGTGTRYLNFEEIFTAMIPAGLAECAVGPDGPALSGATTLEVTGSRTVQSGPTTYIGFATSSGTTSLTASGTTVIQGNQSVLNGNMVFSGVSVFDGNQGTLVGTAAAETWTNLNVVGNAGTVQGFNFIDVLNLKSGGTADDIFDFGAVDSTSGFARIDALGVDEACNDIEASLASLTIQNSGGSTANLDGTQIFTENLAIQGAGNSNFSLNNATANENSISGDLSVLAGTGSVALIHGNDQDTTLAGVDASGDLTISSEGNILDNDNTSTVVGGTADFTTPGSLIIGNNNGDNSTFGSVAFDAADTVFIQSDGAFNLLASSANDAKLIADDLEISGAVAVPNSLEIGSNANRTVGLGASAGDLGLSAAELGFIETTILTVRTGDLAPLTFLNSPSSLPAGEIVGAGVLAGDLTNAGSGDIAVSGLALVDTDTVNFLRIFAGGDADLTFGPAATEISPALVGVASYGGGNGNLLVSGDLSVAGNPNENVLLESEGGTVSIQASVEAAGNLSVLSQGDLTQGIDGDLTAGADIDVESLAGAIIMDGAAGNSASATSTNRNVRYRANGDITLGTLSGSGVAVESVTGSVLDGQFNDTVTGVGADGLAILADRQENIIGQNAQIAAANEIGQGGSAIDLSVDRVAVEAGGSVYLTETNTLELGGAETVVVPRVSRSSTPVGQSFLDNRAIVAGNHLKVQALTGELSTNAPISPGGDLLLAAGGTGSLDLTGNPITVASGDISLITTGDILYNGGLTASGTIDARSGGRFSGSSPFTSGGDLRIVAEANIDLNGPVTAGGNARLEAGGEITESNTSSLSASGLQLIAGGSVGTGLPDGSDPFDFEADNLAVAVGQNAYLQTTGDLAIGDVSVTVNQVGLDSSNAAQPAQNIIGGYARDGHFKLLTDGALTATGLIGGNSIPAGIDAGPLPAASLRSGQDLFLGANGVTLNDAISVGRDLTIDSTGGLAHSDIESGGTIDLDAAGDLANSGSISAGADVRIVSGGDLASGNITTPDNVRLSAGGSITDGAGASVMANGLQLLATGGSIGSGADAFDLNVNEVSVAAGGSVYLNETDGVTIGNVGVTVNEIGLDSSRTATSEQTLSGAAANGGQFNLTSGGSVVVEDTFGGNSVPDGLAPSDDSNGILASDALRLAVTGDLTLTESVSAGSHASISATNDIVQNANLTSGGTLDLTAGRDLTMTTTTTAAEDVRIDLGRDLQNTGLITTAGDVRITARDVLDGDAVSIQSSGLAIDATRNVGDGSAADFNPLNTDVTTLAASGDSLHLNEENELIIGEVGVEVNRVAADGSVSALPEESLSGGLATMDFKLVSEDALTIASSVNASDDLFLQTATGSVTQNAALSAGQDFTILSAGDLTQNADSTAGGSLHLDAAASITSSAVSTAGGDVRHNAGGDIQLTNDGRINTPTGTVRLEAAGNVSDGSNNATSITATGIQLITGDSAGVATADTTNPLNVAVDQIAIAATNNASVDNANATIVGSVNNQVNLVAVDDSASTAVNGSLTGAIAGTGDLRLVSNGALNIADQIDSDPTTDGVRAGGDLHLSSTTADVLLDQTVSSGGDLTILAQTDIAQNSNLSAGDDLDVQSRTGSITMPDGVSATAGTGDILFQADGDITIGSLATAQNVGVEAGGNLIDARDDQIVSDVDPTSPDFGFASTTPANDDRTVNITANEVTLVAGSSIGTSTNPLDTEVSVLSAESRNASGVYIYETDNIEIGAATAAEIDRVGQDLESTPNLGTLIAGIASADTVGVQTIVGDLAITAPVSAARDLHLAANGAGSTLSIGGDLSAGRDASVLSRGDLSQSANITTVNGLDVQSTGGSIAMTGDARSEVTGGLIDDILYQANGSIALGVLDAGGGAIKVLAGAGPITDAGNSTDSNLIAGDLQIITNAGSVGTLENPVDFDVRRFATDVDDGDLFLGGTGTLDFTNTRGATVQRVGLDGGSTAIGENDLNLIEVEGELRISGNGVFTQDEDSPIDVVTITGALTGGSLKLFSSKNQVDNVGEFKLSGGADFFLRDSGRRADPNTAFGTIADRDDPTQPAQALTVIGEVGRVDGDPSSGEGSVWLVVDGQTPGDLEGIEIKDGGSIKVFSDANPLSPAETLVLIGGTNDTGGLSGSGEIIIDRNDDRVGIESGSRLSVRGPADDRTDDAVAHLVFNTASISLGGSDLRGVDIDLFRSLNFSFDPNEDQGGVIDSVINPIASFVDAPGVESAEAALSRILGNRVPRFIEQPSFLYTQAPALDTDTASQASDIASLTREFFADLRAVEQSATLTAEEIAEIAKVARFGSYVDEYGYGPYAVVSYEYDWWLAENDELPGVTIEQDQRIYQGEYPLYLYQAETGKIVPLFRD